MPVPAPMTPPAPHDIRAAAERIAKRMRDTQKRTSYTWLLALEGLIGFSEVSGDASWRAIVEKDIAARGWTADTVVFWRDEPFVCLSWAWARASGDPARIAAFVEGTRTLLRDMPRMDDGLITHRRGETRGGGNAVLLDSFQEYVGRMARAAMVSGDPVFIAECVEQTQKHRAELRDPVSGLWCQGRGWLADRTQRSPGTWSRGQGWLLRGLASACEALPRSDPGYAAMRAIFVEAVDAVCACQQPSGMWHALPHRPATDSGPESSGTAFIAASILRAVRAGVLPTDPYLPHAWRAIAALLPRIDEHGVVHDACPGPGPLIEEGPWLVPHFQPGDPHGPGTVLEALVAALR